MKKTPADKNPRSGEENSVNSEFMATLSHDLRTPLNAIIGFASLLHKEKVGPVSAQQKEFLGDILTSSKYLLHLINNILDLAKVESGKIEFCPKPIELKALCAEVRDILRGLSIEKNIDITVSIAPEVATVELDPEKLRQVLFNYVSNAVKFSTEGGHVTVRFLPEKTHQLRLEVEDKGMGIRPEDIKRLFVKFQQLDQGTGKNHAGTGLGLALTKKIVEAQGGTVEVKSVYGVGSSFSATFPRALSGNRP